jgi:transglutaminase-like putative cysteine protease
MYVERLLQINVAALACLATLLLGMGQRSTLVPVGMLIAAMASVWVTDVKRWFGLSKRIADWAALAALAVCLPGALRWERFAIISAVADFVVLLQVIQLFRNKDAGVYWQIMRLSVLQVVVAALLTQEILFGLLLVVYLFTALGAMSLLFLYSEWQRHQSREPEEAASSAQGRWPMAHQAAVFWSGPTGRAPLGREFFFRLFKIGMAALMAGVLVFVAVPRIGRGAWRGFGGFARATVGFSGGVRLGALGKIIQDPQEVMRVRFFHNGTGERYEVKGGIYLRGAVLTEYRRGEWRPPFGDRPFRSVDWVPSDQVVRDAPVRQEIHLEPLDRDELFCVWPFTFLERDRRIAYFDWALRLARRREFQRDRFVYELGTTAFWKNEQAALTPHDEPGGDTAPLLQMPSENGRSTVPGLVALASQWMAESELPAADRRGRALLLERRLRDSGRFSYSLQGQVRDSALDQVEDFVTKNPKGHCEYFATALCLMLRSQGIPARVVIGYHTDEFNDLGRYFQVRQLHAHTWVEAYLPTAQIPDDVVRERPSWQWLSGAWLRLDATPASGESPGSLSLLARIGGLFDWLNFAWTSYVMEMDRPRQRDAIYQPVADALRTVFRNLTDPEWWRRLWRETVEALGLSRWGAANGWFSWRNVGLVVLIGSVAIGLLWAARAVSVRWIVPLFGSRGRATRAERARVEFYRRFETLLARRGLVRRRCQTQREFALAAATQLDQRPGERQTALPALVVVDAFYSVRFGGATLDEPQAEAVEHALARVAQAVADHNAATGGRA